MAGKDVELIAHLMRRGGFGASRQELSAYAAQGYEATVEGLLDTGDPDVMPDDLIRRYHPEQSAMMYPSGCVPVWLYRMISTKTPLEEKIALLWHGIFATGYPKITQGKREVSSPSSTRSMRTTPVSQGAARSNKVADTIVTSTKGRRYQ